MWLAPNLVNRRVIMELGKLRLIREFLGLKVCKMEQAQMFMIEKYKKKNMKKEEERSERREERKKKVEDRRERREERKNKEKKKRMRDSLDLSGNGLSHFEEDFPNF